jgi:hypothetical protein
MNRKQNVRVWIIGIASAIAFLFGAFATTAASAAPAARHLPKIQTAPSGWHSSSWKVRPSAVYFGGGASFAGPMSRHLSWVRYGNSTAYARGQVWVDYCKPSCAGAGHWARAVLYFYGVYSHSGPGRNFGNARVYYWTRHGKKAPYVGTGGRFFIMSNGDWNWNYPKS